MRRAALSLPTLTVAGVSAQGDLAGLLATRPELSTLLELVNLAGLNSTLSTGSNITIVAPTNDAFAKVNPSIPEGQALVNRNSTSVTALLVNHVFNGSYPAETITEVPTFAQTLLTPEYQNDIQPFTDINGGNYNGLVRNSDRVQVLSGEFTVSNVLQADLRLGEAVVIHVIDTVLSFNAPFLLFAAREGYAAFNGAIEAANVSLSLGLEDPAGADVASTDLTFFVPQNSAFEAVGSVLANVDAATLTDVLEYHIIPNNIIFSPSISNSSVPSLQGADLQFTVLDDETIFVNGARIVLPNVLLSNGVAHGIDNVLNPADASESRSEIDFSAPASERTAFSSATSVTALPFTSSLSFGSEVVATPSVPAIFTTAPVVAVGTTSGVASASSGGFGSYSTGVIPFTGGAVLPTWAAVPWVVGVAAGGVLAVV